MSIQRSIFCAVFLWQYNNSSIKIGIFIASSAHDVLSYTRNLNLILKR